MTQIPFKLAESIRSHGHALVSTQAAINGRDISFGYTVGLCNQNLPELIIFGLPPKALSILNDAASLLREIKLPLDTPIYEISNLPLIVRRAPAHAVSEFICQANFYAKRELSALQLFWPDTAGIFPWEPTFDPQFSGIQPLLYQASH